MHVFFTLLNPHRESRLKKYNTTQSRNTNIPVIGTIGVTLFFPFFRRKNGRHFKSIDFSFTANKLSFGKFLC